LFLVTVALYETGIEIEQLRREVAISDRAGFKGKANSRVKADSWGTSNDFHSTKNRSWKPRERKTFTPTDSPYLQGAGKIRCGPNVEFDLFRIEADTKNCWRSFPLVFGGLVWQDINGVLKVGTSKQPSEGDWWSKATLASLVNARDNFLIHWKQSAINYLDCHPSLEVWASVRATWKHQGWFDHQESTIELGQQIAFIPATNPSARVTAIKFIERVVQLGLRLGGEATLDAKFFLEAVVLTPYLSRHDEVEESAEQEHWEERIKGWQQSLSTRDQKPLIRNAPESEFNTDFIAQDHALDTWRQQPYGIEPTALVVTGFPAVGKSHFMFELARRVVSRFKNGAVWVALDSYGEGASFEEQLANALEFPPDAKRDFDTLCTYLERENLLVILDQLDVASDRHLSSVVELVLRLKQSKSHTGFLLGAGNTVRLLIGDVPVYRLQPLDEDACRTVFLQSLSAAPQGRQPSVSKYDACAIAVAQAEGLPGVIKEFALSYSTGQWDSAIQAGMGGDTASTGGVSAWPARFREMFMNTENVGKEIALAQRVASVFEGLFDDEALVDLVRSYGVASPETLPNLLVKHSRLIRRNDGLLYLPMVARSILREHITPKEHRRIRWVITSHYVQRSNRSRNVFGQENHLLAKQIGNLQLMWEEVLGNPQEFSSSLVNIAEVASDLSKFDYVGRLVGECLNVTPDAVSQISALTLLARVNRIERQFDVAEENCHRAQAMLDQRRGSLDPETQLMLQAYIATEQAEKYFATSPFSHRGQGSTEWVFLTSSLSELTSRFAGFDHLRPQTLLAKGKVIRALGKLHLRSNLAYSRSLFEEASTVFDDIAHWSELGATLSDLGNIHLLDVSGGSIDQASALFQRTVRLFGDLGSNLYQRQYARSMGCLGNAALKRQDLADAKRYFEQCLSLLSPYGNTADLVNTYLNLGWVDILTEQLSYAATHLSRVLERATTDELTKNALSACACIALQTGQAKLAEEVTASVPISELDPVFKQLFLRFFPRVDPGSHGSEDWPGWVPKALTMLKAVG
jgi:tetratricopeptide (TPR) repeat protein